MGGFKVQKYQKRTWRGLRYFFRIVAANGEKIASCQTKGYLNKYDRDYAATCIANDRMPVFEVAR